MTDCAQLEEIEKKLFLQSDPRETCVEQLRACAERLRAGGHEHELARTLVLLHSVQPEDSDEGKAEAKAFYDKQLGTFNILRLLEGARACCVYEERDEALKFIKEVQDILDFYPKLQGVRVPREGGETTRLICAARSDYSTSVPSSGIAPVELPGGPIKYTEEDDALATSLLSDYEYLVILLLASTEHMSQAASRETILAYLYRVTETKEFDKIHWTIQEQALYFRTLLETSSIEALERGALQLAKVSEFLRTKPSLGSYISCVEVVTWQEVDSSCAQRLVAMRDYANALPYLERLQKPLQTARCLHCLGRSDEAVKLLQSTEFSVHEQPEVSMLEGSISLDPKYWARAWELGRIPEAQFRLYEHCISHSDTEAAAKHLEELLKVYPTNFEALSLLGQLLVRKQAWPEAVSVLQRAVAERDDEYQTWLLLASALVHAEKPEPGLHALQQAVRVNQNAEVEASTWSNYVALSTQLSKWDDVILGFGQLLAQDIDKTHEFLGSLMGCYIRLVEHYLDSVYTGSREQLQFLNLVSEFRNVSADDDPVIARLTGKALVWSGKRDEGLGALSRAVERVIESAKSDPSGKARLRVDLYFKEFQEALGEDEDWSPKLQAFETEIDNL